MNKNLFRIIYISGITTAVILLISCKSKDDVGIDTNACIAKLLPGKAFIVKQNTGRIFDGSGPVDDVPIGEIKFLDDRSYTSTVKLWADTGSYRIIVNKECNKDVWLQLLQNNRQVGLYATYQEQVESNGNMWFRIRNVNNKSDTLNLGIKAD